MSETQTAVNAIEMHGIVMEFSGVRALDGVDFSLRQGQVMGLVGKNGAGKSTLMKIINGVYTQTAGTVQFFGKNIDKSVSVREREQTVAMIYQDYSLVGEMTVAENIFLNTEPIRGALISDRDCIRKAAEFFRDMGIRIDPRQKGQVPLHRRYADGRDRKGHHEADEDHPHGRADRRARRRCHDEVL